jgi:hypothetical protein
MTRILVVGEDALCCALGERLVGECLPGWGLAGPSIDTRGVTRLRASLSRYAEVAAHVQPVLCVADTDGGCAATLPDAWLPKVPARLILRLAVPEAESWVLADSARFAEAIAVPVGKVPREPDRLTDPKSAVLGLARRSRVRAVRTEVVSALDPGRPGSGYNEHLVRFVRQCWRAGAASECSPSLQRAVRRLRALASSA